MFFVSNGRIIKITANPFERQLSRIIRCHFFKVDATVYSRLESVLSRASAEKFPRGANGKKTEN